MPLKWPATLRGVYAHVPPTEAEVLIAIGGDGFMLETLHNYHHLNLPVYGINWWNNWIFNERVYA